MALLSGGRGGVFFASEASETGPAAFLRPFFQVRCALLSFSVALALKFCSVWRYVNSK